MSIKVTMHAVLGANSEQEAIVRRGAALLEVAVNDVEFIPKVRRTTYRQTRFRTANGDEIKIPPSEVAGYLESGLERDSQSDGEIDLAVHLWPYDPPSRDKPGTVGASFGGKLPFKTAYWFINRCIEKDDPVSVARHFCHEWLHVAGFIHWPNQNARFDVPYRIGQIVVDILSEQVVRIGAMESPEMKAALEEAVDLEDHAP